MRSTLTLLLGASLLAACGDSATDTYNDVETVDPVPAATVEDTTAATAAELMIGEWNQETPFTMTVGDNSFTIMNGEAEYDADGTSEIEAMLIVGGLADGENSYEIELDGTYSLSGDTLTETFTAAEVEPVSANDTTRAVAQAIEDALGTAGTTTSTVVSIDDAMLVRTVPGLGELRYSRDMD